MKDLSPDSGIGSSQEWPVVDVFQIVMQQKHPTSGTSKISTKSELNENVEDDIEKRSSEGVVSSSIDPIADNKIESQTSIQETKGSENSSSFSSANTNCNVKTGRKRHLSESSLSDFDLMPHQTKIPKIMISDTDQFSQSQKSDLGSDVGSSSFISSVTEKSNVTDSENLKTSNSENSELCMFCQNAPKDAIFLHTKVAHQCCCYKCAKRTIKTRKRCPICNVTVNKVYRVIKS